MAGRGELTEEAWNAIAPLPPSSSGRQGGQWRDHRTVINGIRLQLPTLSPLFAAATDAAHHSRTIPERRDQRAQRAGRPGWPLCFDKAIYARRNVVERCINRLKQWRGLATRYEKRAANYRAMVVLASIGLWLQS